MVERSDSYDGAWGDGPDDDVARYPSAPVPAHERTWRHPSEVGQAQWVQSEPPLALGRGLMATTGLVGCALGLAVVWLLVPGGLDQEPVAGPTVTRSIGAVGGVGVTTPPPASLLAPTTALAQSSSTTPAEAATSHTVAVQTAVSAAPATAVLIEGTGLLLTTAAAVREQRRIALEDASEVVHEARVVGTNGELVVLIAGNADDTPVDVAGFQAIGAAREGDQVIVLAATPLQAAYPAAGEELELDSAVESTDIAEGTPVVDADGVLVGLCTHTLSGTDEAELRVLPIADVISSLLGDQPSGTTPVDESLDSSADVDENVSGPGGWIGLRLVERNEPASVQVDRVAPDSPAALAGIAGGETIRSIDGVAVVSVADVRAALAGTVPGDTVLLTLLAPDGTERQVSVVLGVVAPDV